MATSVEILLRAKNETDAAFKALLKNLETTGESAKKANDALGKMADEMGGKFQSAASGMSSKLGPLGDGLSALGPYGMAAAAGIGAVVAALGLAAKVTIDATLAAMQYADNLSAMADKTGLSTDALQSLEVAAKL